MNAPYLVVCMDEGTLVLASRRTFPNREKAQTYADTVCSSREPTVVETVKPFVIEPMSPVRNHQEHIERHVYCHAVLDELMADFFNVTGKRPSEATVSELVNWSANQTHNPQLPKGMAYADDDTDRVEKPSA